MTLNEYNKNFQQWIKDNHIVVGSKLTIKEVLNTKSKLCNIVNDTDFITHFIHFTYYLDATYVIDSINISAISDIILNNYARVPYQAVIPVDKYIKAAKHQHPAKAPVFLQGTKINGKLLLGNMIIKTNAHQVGNTIYTPIVRIKV